ncbi:ECA polysaccharide chain length modulation protein [Erwinia amylovora]|uniref:ECA polysaccharide chain length modulation protein n=5 Tax=Erwinia amylovora TaxID=552 RepID=A0A830ZW74_ERWAM|nr:ECA polysaccharide chain length modulation protein [Erwinia amylovora]CBX78988.1 Lipopolysaccharide biosynthesis protein wzzE [Erwinia amylovora ATCC BAA-2158]CCP01280.1 Lipopolysaccharide biosynthesis protein wzzE [Erwinia amylovora Ea644]CCP05264.1 Lipopolysaccharide biosynthesis protein wzzE [Erwinia amylovora MR1]CDK13792.1 Lipopolysaccharide biosynthesis protein wzzE [Erwinia amylovora LA635]CDK17159.1 Lipopolysaccharide biosynthesis protein wzzE [Erwinia amylovora LA636]CDK20528.1 Li
MNHPDAGDNELDIRGLCCALWCGKLWIIAGGGLFALLAWVYSLLVTPQWSTIAIVDRPTVNALSGFYSQQQFLKNLDMPADNLTVAPQTVIDEAYQEFIMQLFAWDSRREFWLHSSYYQNRKSGNARQDAALLDELIANIQLQPADSAKNINDTVKIVAETAADANTLLRQYVAFANARATAHLNQELRAAWAARSIQIKAQIKRQQDVAKAIYLRQLNSVRQALKIAQQQGFEQSRTQTPSEQLPDSELFLLGRPMLQARLENLLASGPSYELAYYQNRAMMTTLNVGPTLVKSFQAWRYLRTPEEPVKRDSPRRALLMMMWGAVGVLVGAGTVLIRRPRR